MAMTHFDNSYVWSNINGKAIPHSKYPIDSTYDNADCSTGIECVGFGRFIHKYLFGEENSGTASGTVDTSTAAKAKAFVATLGPGSRLTGYGGTSYSDHTMILLGYDSTAMAIYHANWGAYNQVRISRFTYEDFAGRYKTGSAWKK
jgi:hypothetical protein